MRKDENHFGALPEKRRYKSCGCLKPESIVKAHTTHGLAHHPLYSAWSAMIQRCENPKNRSYPDYGFRGIKVCERWRHDFSAFLADMGERPPGCSLDRKDNDLGYDKDNCEWKTADRQGINKRNNKRLIYEGQELTVSQVAKLSGIPAQTLYSRAAKQRGNA